MKIKKSIVVAISVIAFFCVILVACKTTTNISSRHREESKSLIEKVDSSRKIVSEAQDVINKSADVIADDAESIREGAAGVEAVIPQEALVKAKPLILLIDTDAQDIKRHTEVIKEHTVNLGEATVKLSEAKVHAAAIEKEAKEALSQRDAALKKEAKAREDLEKEKTKARNAVRRYMAVLIVCATLGIAIGIGLFIMGNKWGLAVSGGCAVLIALASFVTKFIDYFAYAGGALALITIAIVAWTVWNRQKAITETTEMLEASKDLMTQNQRKALFGHRAAKGLAHSYQSPSTRNIIKTIREKKKEEWEPTIEHDYPDDAEVEKVILSHPTNGSNKEVAKSSLWDKAIAL